MAGYCIVHLLEHTIISHFHYGEETHHDEFVSARTGYSVLGGLSVHALFDGVAIGSGFVGQQRARLADLSRHIPSQGARRLHHGVRHAGQRTQPRRRILSAVALAVATIAGVLIIELVPRLDALWPAGFGRRGPLRRRKRPGA